MERIRPGSTKIKTKPPINWRRLADQITNAPSVQQRVDPFAANLDLHPPGVVPRNHSKMAQDTAIVASTAWASAVITSSFNEGVQFLGYPYLSALAQRPEYRVITQTIAEEMTRKGGKFEAKGDSDADDGELRGVLGQDAMPPQLAGKGAPPAQPGPPPSGGPPPPGGAPGAMPGMPPPPPAPPSPEEVRRKAKLALKEARAKIKAKRISQLEEMFKKLSVMDNVRHLVELDGFFGRGHLYLDTGDKDDPAELRLSIGSGNDNLSKIKVTPDKPLRRIKCIEPVWCYPTNYNSIDPTEPAWYNPEHWFVMSKEYHSSRMLKLVGNEVPDMLKPAYSFGGLSMSQMAQPYVNNWLQTRQSVNDLIQAFVVWGLKTNLSESLTPSGDQLFARLDLFNRARNNRGVFLLDKDTEEFFNITAPLSGLEALQAQSQEHMASVSRIPLVKLLGIQPTGLNASSEGEIRVFYDTIAGRQESLLTKIVVKLMHFCMLSLWGEIDEDIIWTWTPLWEMTEKELAEVDDLRAKTAQVRIDTGVVDKLEERRRIAEEPDSPYPGLDPNYEPDLKQEEEEGLVPKGGGPVVKEEMEQEESGGEPPPDDDDNDNEGTERPPQLAAAE